MPIARPFAGKSSDRLTNLINRYNVKKVTLGVDFVFGDLRIVSHPDYNTEVDLIPLNEFYRPQVIKYTRLPLSAYVNSGGVLAPVQAFYNEFEIYDILDELSEGVGIDFEERDLINTSHVRANTQVLRIDPAKSLGWVSGELVFDVQNIDARLTTVGRPRSTEDGDVMINVVL